MFEAKAVLMTAYTLCLIKFLHFALLNNDKGPGSLVLIAHGGIGGLRQTGLCRPAITPFGQ